MDCSPPDSSVHGILQARILEWVAIPSSRGPSQPRDRTCMSCFAGGFFTTEPQGKPQMLCMMCIISSVQSLSCVGLFATPWTVACQAPLSMGFSRQEYWSGLPCPSLKSTAVHFLKRIFIKLNFLSSTQKNKTKKPHSIPNV